MKICILTDVKINSDQFRLVQNGGELDISIAFVAELVGPTPRVQ